MVDGNLSTQPAGVAVESHSHTFADSHGRDVSEMESTQITNVVVDWHMPTLEARVLINDNRSAPQFIFSPECHPVISGRIAYQRGPEHHDHYLRQCRAEDKDEEEPCQRDVILQVNVHAHGGSLQVF